MPIKIRTNPAIPVHRKRSSELFKKPGQTFIAKDGGSHIINNTNANKLNSLIFNTLDKMTPILKKHSKFNKLVISLSEKIIRFSGNF